jgi:SNF family Na+-dependent transporter
MQCWRMAPIFKGKVLSLNHNQKKEHTKFNLGLGISMSIMSFFLTVYYAMLIGYSILYFVLSFRSKLEWATCGPWSSPSIRSKFCVINFFL